MSGCMHGEAVGCHICAMLEAPEFQSLLAAGTKPDAAEDERRALIVAQMGIQSAAARTTLS